MLGREACGHFLSPILSCSEMGGTGESWEAGPTGPALETLPWAMKGLALGRQRTSQEEGHPEPGTGTWVEL